MVLIKISFAMLVLVAIAMANENIAFDECSKLVNRLSDSGNGLTYLESDEEKTKVKPEDLLNCLGFMYELAIRLENINQNIDDSSINHRETRRLKQFWKRKVSWLKNNKNFW